jgi:DNA-binding NtrC family response regulator
MQCWACIGYSKVILMIDKGKKRLKVMIIEEEEDILTLYRDYLSIRGHNVVSCSLNSNNIITNFEKCEPDICLIDPILRGKGIGIDAAAQILENSPSTPILFTTAYESLKSELPKHHEFEDKNIQVLMKPARLSEIEDSMLSMVHN